MRFPALKRVVNGSTSGDDLSEACLQFMGPGVVQYWFSRAKKGFAA